MPLLLRTAVAFLFLACVGGNEQVTPGTPEDQLQPEIAAAVEEDVPTERQPEDEPLPQVEHGDDPASDVVPIAREEAVSPSSPGLFGVKSFVIGLIVAAFLLHFSLTTSRVHNSTSGYTEDTGKSLRQTILAPLRDEDAVRLPYLAAVGIMLSGFYNILASIGRKIMARMGKNVSLAYPKRGKAMWLTGIFLLVAAVGLVFLTQNPMFIILFHISCGLIMAGTLLSVASSIQRRRHTDGLQ